MSGERQALFARERMSAEHRLARETVAFIGHWGLRKGSSDWPEIVRCVWSQRPGTRFLFLGTGWPADIILSDLGLGMGDERIRVVPTYDSGELAGLLRDATVGAFPSYIEGFPFAVLELLAAGLPTVTYDVPGPREMLGDLGPAWMVPPGDTATLPARLLDLLGRALADYRLLSEACTATADRFSWGSIAQQSLKAFSRLTPLSPAGTAQE
jgi:glycosyltransferase involved in cell wall biosynthesis